MENKSFEELIAELEAIVNKLEGNKLSLEDSVKEYQRGIELSVECKKRLDQAKSVVVTKMTENGEKEFRYHHRLFLSAHRHPSSPGNHEQFPCL